jgi:hypothetical protein
MIEDRFANLIRHSYQLPIEEEQPQDTMLAAGPITSDVPQTGVRLGRAGVTPQQSAKAGGLDKPLIALLDTLAGALRGATGATIGLPGDIRSIVDMINQEGAEAVMGKRMFPTSEEVLQSNILPPVIPAGAPNAAERQKTVDIAQKVGEFLPAPGLLDVPKVVKGATKAVQATKGMPVGMSTQMVGEGVSELGFYSAAKEAVDAIQQPKGTGEQFLKQIEKTPGVKPDEIKWTGLDDFLKSKKTVTKAEVQEYLDKNRVEIKEVRLGEQETFDPARLKQLETEYASLKQHPIDDPSFGGEKYDEMIKLMNIRDRSTTDSLYESSESATRAAQRAQARGMKDTAEKYFREAELYGTRAEKLDLNDLGMENPTKYGKYQLPGGENYREILLTLPQKPSKFELVDAKGIKMSGQFDNQTDAQKFIDDFSVSGGMFEKNKPNIVAVGDKNKQFKSQHFDQPNILAHIRVNDRVIDGKKTLFVEEVQSDWHQAGRKKGYESKDGKYGEKVTDEEYKRGVQLQNQQRNQTEPLTPAEQAELNDIMGRHEASIVGARVPDAPFKTTWSDLSMKRVIQMASEGGYDRVAFTTGKTQAERYDLSKQISEVHLSGTDLVAYDKNGDTVIKQTGVTKDNLADYIGKEPAQKLLDQKPQGTLRSISGVDLQVGGEGMKGFYDDILPKFLNKYAKKWDAKVGMTDIRLATDKQDMADSDLLGELGLPRGGKAVAQVQYIDVTPKMKESVLTKGQPLFAVGGAGAAMQQEDNK